MKRLDSDSHTHTGAGAREESPEPEPERKPHVAKGRSGQDRADLERAIEILCLDLRTQPVAFDLGRQHATRQFAPIVGWQWLIAAEKLQGEKVPDEARDSFPYYVGIAKNVKESERTRRERGPGRTERPEPPRQDAVITPEMRKAAARMMGRKVDP